MKKTLLFVAAAMISGLSYGQMLPNSGFEVWENLQGGSNPYSEPEEWNTANECSELLNVQSVSQSADAHSGASSAKLETMPTGLGAVIVNGVVTTATMICDPFNPGQTGGYDFTTRPDSLVFWAKYAPVDTDNGYAQVIMFNATGDTIAYEKFDILVAVTAWTRYAVKINWMNSDMPAVASVLFNSSWGNGNNGEGFVGSVMYVDDVEWTMGPNSISELEASKWKVYPNPVEGELTITTHQEGGNVLILDVTGKKVVKRTINELESQIDVSNLPTGIYLYQLRTVENEVVKTGKLLINP